MSYEEVRALTSYMLMVAVANHRDTQVIRYTGSLRVSGWCH